MRRRVLWPVLLLPLTVACTAILGDFTVGSGGDAGDSGGQDVASDVSDGGINDAPVDVGPDSPALVSCGEVANKRRQITTASINGIGVHTAIAANGNARVVLANYISNDSGPAGAELRAYTFDPKNNSSQINTAIQPTNNYQVLQIAHYPGQPGGFAAIWSIYDQTSQKTNLYASRIQDDQPSWTAPRELGVVASGTASSLNNIEASFMVLDPQNDVYYVVFSYVTGTTQVIVGGTTSGPADILPTVASFTVQNSGQSAFDLVSPGIAKGGTQEFALLNASTNGPPTPGLPELLLVPGQQNVQYTPPSNLNYIPLAMTNGADPAKANVAVLEVDLTQEIATYRVGRMPFSSMGTFNPSTLPGSLPPFVPSDAGFSKLANVTFGNSPHWEPTSEGEQMLIASPTVDPLLEQLYGGINFGWWDGQTGALRAYLASSNHILGNVANIEDCDVSFVNLAGNLASLEVAYLTTVQPPQGHNFPPPTADLWVTQMGCQ